MQPVTAQTTTVQRFARAVETVAERLVAKASNWRSGPKQKAQRAGQCDAVGELQVDDSPEATTKFGRRCTYGTVKRDKCMGDEGDLGHASRCQQRSRVDVETSRPRLVGKGP